MSFVRQSKVGQTRWQVVFVKNWPTRSGRTSSTRYYYVVSWPRRHRAPSPSLLRLLISGRVVPLLLGSHSVLPPLVAFFFLIAARRCAPHSAGLLSPSTSHPTPRYLSLPTSTIPEIKVGYKKQNYLKSSRASFQLVNCGDADDGIHYPV